MILSANRLLSWSTLPLSIFGPSIHNNKIVGYPARYMVNVDPAFIEATRVKASCFRPSIPLNQSAWEDGPPVSFIGEVAEYWANHFDWFDYQDQINKNFTQYITTVPGPGASYMDPLDLYFIHQQSARSDAIPIVFLHGWPSTSLEWKNIIHPLVNPPNDTLPAFNVVAPDLPGFGFSPAPTKPGLGPLEHARVVASLMTQLGYDRFVIYATDLGVPIAQAMVLDTEIGPRIINFIADVFIVNPSPSDRERQANGVLTEEEKSYITAFDTFFNHHIAYADLHASFPLSAAYAFNDSPVGFLAWMYQLVYSMTDLPQTPRDLIERALPLYIPGVYGNIRAYKELYPKFSAKSATFSNVPTSIIQGGNVSGYVALKNFNFVPRDWIERSANVTYFSRHAIGGHFPAETAPQLVLEDIWTIVGLAHTHELVSSEGRGY